MTKLLPCPFCGGGASMRTEYDTDGSECTWKHIQCDKCRARSGGKWFSKGNDCPQFYEEVRDEWNQRERPEVSEWRWPINQPCVSVPNQCIGGVCDRCSMQAAEWRRAALEKHGK